jgi:hypothetical protein
VTETTQTVTSSQGQTCPKCQLVRTESQHNCPRCGLEFARWNPDVADTIKPLDADGEALWNAAIADWSNEERHLTFVKHCSLAGMLAASGRRYRDWLLTHPADATAIAMQKRILGMAQAMLGSNSSRPSASMLSSKWFWTIVIVAMTAGMTAAFLIRR